MMNHEYIEAHQIIDRYIMGTLSESERDAFGEHFIGCDECLDQLELSDSFQRNLKQAAASLVARPNLRFRLERHWLGNVAMAALLLLVSGVAYHFYSEVEKLHQPSIPPLVYELHAFRGTTDYKFVYKPGQTAALILVDTDPEGVHVRWRLLNDREDVVFQGEGPGGKPTTPLFLHRSNLKPGHYTLQVESVLEDGQVRSQGRYPFEVSFE